MVDQASFDELADGLVAAGIKVTYDNLNEAWRERSETGAGKSDRDWQAPFADWRRRRRYKPHLALLDLPDDMEKAIAAFAGRAIEIARRHAGGASKTPPPPVAQPHPDPSATQQVTELVARMEARLSALSAGQMALAEQVASLAAGGAPTDILVTEPPSSPPAQKPKREGRRRGLSASMGRVFWDRMMKGFSDRIRERGPMTAQELLETLDEDALAMAKAAFEEVDLTMLTEKLDFRVSKKNYFSKLADGRYALLGR